jgi:hypothetical protein
MRLAQKLRENPIKKMSKRAHEPHAINVLPNVPDGIRNPFLDPESRQEHPEIRKYICGLKDRLRDALVYKHDNAVISDRATFKTTALVEFVAERLLALAPPAEVGVVTPDTKSATLFMRAFTRTFPNVRLPLVEPYVMGNSPFWCGLDVREVYADEMFKIPYMKLREIPHFVCGIGTLNEPVSLRIDKW